jgi:UDP-N-acetylmuramate--alanine ligase
MFNGQKSQEKPRKAYLIGIKGVGMTALAQILQSRGFDVSGSDTSEKFFTDAVLQKHGILFKEGFSRQNVPQDASMIIASSAYCESNPEVAEAQKTECGVKYYAEALGELFKGKEGIAVCGSHGKTTTSAMLAYIFREAGLDPGAIIGSEVPQFNGSALSGTGKFFIAESDEYQNKLRFYDPRSAILTSVDYDHPDFFKTPAEYRQVFIDFIKRLPEEGFLVACSDDAGVCSILRETSAHVVLYGIEDGARKEVEGLRAPFNSWTAKNIVVADGCWEFDAFKNGAKFGGFKLLLPGRHNVQNALGAIAMADAYGVDYEKIARALGTFGGTRRRFERVGHFNGAIVVDDYGHHPTEIKATLLAARELWPARRIVAVFHPHTFTRTKALLADFAKSFGAADETIVLDIYGSAREERGGVSSEELVAMARAQGANVKYVPDILQAERLLEKSLGANDVLITIGAGDVWKIGSALITKAGVLNASERNAAESVSAY